MKIDLHMHSTISDGKLSPIEVIDYAIKNNLKAIALTDHDNLSGIKIALKYSKDKNIEIVPGVELTADPENLAKELHILGLFIDPSNKEIKKLISKQRESRVEKTKKVIIKLNELGYKLTYEEVEKESKKDVFGRQSIAESLLKRYPQFKTKRQIFDELLGETGKAFLESEASTTKEIIEAIHSASGLAILAHPGYLYSNAEKVIDNFINLGGDGIEVDYPYERVENSSLLRDKFRKIANEKNLIISGGTDFHNLKENPPLGTFGLTDTEFKAMKERLKKIYNSK